MNTPTDKDKQELEELKKEARQLTVELKELSDKARRQAHDYAKSFSDHPNGCIYCDKRHHLIDKIVSETRTLEVPKYDDEAAFCHTCEAFLEDDKYRCYCDIRNEERKDVLDILNRAKAKL